MRSGVYTHVSSKGCKGDVKCQNNDNQFTFNVLSQVISDANVSEYKHRMIY